MLSGLLSCTVAVGTQRVFVPVKLADNPIFAPTLNLTIRDTRLGGISKPIIGTASIPLSAKLPWSPTYQPPCGAPHRAAPFRRKQVP